MFFGKKINFTILWQIEKIFLKKSKKTIDI